MSRRAITLVVLLAALCLRQDSIAAKKPNPTTYTGQFTVFVHGYWNGQGTATVTGTTVQIQATVADDAGNTGALTVNNLNIIDNHFEGNGTVFGQPMHVAGRLEAQDPPPAGTPKGKGKGKGSSADAQVLLDARIGATFNAGPHGGRIAGSRDG
jgi:hypothetical protein